MSSFDVVGVAVETPKMLRLEINDPNEAFEKRYYMWKLDVEAYLHGKRKNVPIYKLREENKE